MKSKLSMFLGAIVGFAGMHYLHVYCGAWAYLIVPILVVILAAILVTTDGVVP